MSTSSAPLSEGRDLPSPPTPQRFLTTQSKSSHPDWIARASLLPGWHEEVMQAAPGLMSWPRSIYWAWRFFRESKRYAAIVTGNERAALLFAALQYFVRRKKVPHILMMQSPWTLPDGRHRRALKKLWLHAVAGGLGKIGLFSEFQLSLYTRTFRLPPSKLAVVYYHTTFRRSSYDISDERYLFAGGDSNRDYRTLIEAVGGLSCRLVISALRRDHFDGLVIPPNVEIVTSDPDEFLELMARASIVVVPMKAGLVHSGGHQTYLNAMSMGKPVIVVDDCGAEDYVTHQKNGILVPPRDPEQLRRAIQLLMEDVDLARSLGANARRVSSNYSPEVFFQRIFSLVDDCCVSCSDVGSE